MLQAKELVAFVPTRGNEKYTMAMVDQLKELHHVIFLATDVDPGLLDLPSNFSLLFGGKRQDKRNRAIEIARSMSLPYCLQIDDDLRVKNGMASHCEQVVNTLLGFDFLGATCTQHRMMYGMQWLPREHSHPFVFKNFPSQLMAIKIEAFDEVKPYRLTGMDDVEKGMQLWAKGWGVGALNLMHNEIRARGGSPSQGGLPEAEYEAALQADLVMLREEPKILTKVETRIDKKGRTRPTLRWDWNEMLKRFHDRWPDVKYYDNVHRVGA